MKKFIKTIMLLGTILGLAVSCLTQKCVPTIEYRDSIRTEYKLDSVYVYERDSVYIDRYRSNDTVYLIKEKWSTRWKDKVVEKHDTIYVNNETTVVQTEEVIPKFYKNCTIGFWILLIAIILIIVAKILIKIYLKR